MTKEESSKSQQFKLWKQQRRRQMNVESYSSSCIRAVDDIVAYMAVQNARASGLRSCLTP